MAHVNNSRASTPIAILGAAERLFGEFGIEGVSIRQIGLAAKVANKSAISYHFGDRADLVRAIWGYRLPILETRRQQLLAQLRAEDMTDNSHAVVRTLILPLFGTVDADGCHYYAAFFLAAMRWREGRRLREEELTRTPASADAMTMQAAIASNLSVEQLNWRLRFAVNSFLDMLVERDADFIQGLPIAGDEIFMREAVDMVVAYCLRPWPR